MSCRYTRNLVDEGNGKFNLMLLCWGPSQASCIHDHTDAHCFMKILSGELEEVRYEWPENAPPTDCGGMRMVGKTPLHTNGVCYINDSLGLHRVCNPSDSDPAVSLHLYCPPFSSCQVFDEVTGKRTKCPVTFFSKYGKKIKYCETECAVQLLASVACLPASVACLPASVACLSASVACLPASVACLPASVECLPASVACLLASVACLPASVACLPASVACLPASVACLPASVACLFASVACLSA
ncbi:Cysteine dioxygenase type I [Trinorchestia longiramus]|nr:Cysteine dioxygenase type I [Trinorchestia longiramus]